MITNSDQAMPAIMCRSNPHNIKVTKSVSGLTSQSGVTANSAYVSFLSTDLIRIIGAQEPSGVPYLALIVEKRDITAGPAS